MKSGKDHITIIIFFLLFVSNFFLFSDGLAYLDEEDSKTIFQSTLEDEDVSLTLYGSWDLDLSASIGITWNSLTGKRSFSSFPGMSPGLFFGQSPDLTLLLYFQDKYFFETTVIGDMNFDTFLLGYDGIGDEFLKKVRIGNIDTGISRYGSLQLADPLKNSIGASVTAGTGISQHELTMRYEFTEKNRKLYIGNHEVVEERINPVNYIEGRFFYLPDSDIDNIIIYIENSSGSYSGSDGYYYKIAEDTEVTYSLKEGKVSFLSPLPGRALIWYSKQGLEVGNPSLGTEYLHGTSGNLLDPDSSPEDFNWTTTYLGKDMSELRITIEGKDCLLLKEFKTFSPFENLGFYTFPGTVPDKTWKTLAFLASPGEYTGEPLVIESIRNENLLLLTGLAESERDPLNRFPLSRFPFLYGSSPLTAEEYSEKEIILQSQIYSEYFQIEPGAAEGSVQIVKNGHRETGFSIDYQSGIIDFFSPVGPEDRIEIIYRLKSTELDRGEIIFGMGNNFIISPELSVFAASGLRWSISDAEYSEQPGQNNGALIASVGGQYHTEYLNASFEAGLSLYNPDTTGRIRISGMEDDGLSIQFSDKTVFPSSIPVDITDININNRGKLLFKDYYLYNSSGATYLNHYDWLLPENQEYKYENESVPGPYIASGGSEIPGHILVMDYELSQEQRWVGAQVPVLPGSDALDLSDSRSLGFYWKGINTDIPVSVFLQIGAAGEDLDGDGNLDSETNKYADGYSFNDISSGVIMLIGGGTQGTGNGIIDTEDNDRNGILNIENTQLIYTKEYSSTTLPGDEWNYEQIFFSSEDRSKLRAASFIRVVIRNNSTETETGRLLIGNLQFTGSVYKAESESVSGIINVREITENGVEAIFPAASGQELINSHSEIARVFHPGNETQKVLEVSWSNIDSGEIEVSGYPAAIPTGIYKKLNMYIRLPVLPGTDSEMNISYTDTFGDGITASFKPEVYEEWVKLIIDLSEKTLSINGVIIPDADVTFSESSSPLTRLSISLTGVQNSTDTNALYIDEIHFDQTSAGISGGFSGSLRYTNNETLIEAAGIPIFGNIVFAGTGFIRGDNFGSEFITQNTQQGISADTELAFDLLFLNLKTEADLVYTGTSPFISGGHTVILPAHSPYFSISDSFNVRNRSSGKNMFRANSISISIPSILTLSVGIESISYSEKLIQSWNGTIKSILELPVTFSFTGNFESVSSGFSSGLEGYFTSWINSYVFVLPESDLINLERSSDFSFETGFSVNSFAINIKPEAGCRILNYGEQTQSSYSSLLLSFPLIFNNGTPKKWSLTWDLNRKAANSADAAGSETFSDDISLLIKNMQLQDYLYISIPFLELGDSRTAERFMQNSSSFITSSYKPEYSFQFSRNYGSYLHDLFLPSIVNLKISRNLIQNYDLINDSIDWQCSLRSTVLNLFGSNGVYPVFKFYKSEEISNSLTITGSLLNSTAGTLLLLMQNYLKFEGNGGNSLVLSNNFNQDFLTPAFSEKVDITYTWDYYPEEPIKLSFIENIRGDLAFLYFSNHETIQVKGSFNFQNNQNTFLVKLKHETDMIVPMTGKLTFFVGIGVETESFTFEETSGLIINTGFEIGIHAKIGF